MPGLVSELGGVRVASDHDDRFAVLFVELRENGKHFVGRARVEITRRLIGQDDRKIRPRQLF